ncbi:S8 family peptidase [Anaerobacillus sp. CMMVII]|uniref:S8 family peptidase n=1 Tax=Anaerobacillus sp. CMMVII TaxID=2755588 RepID=UPI0021B6E776|nr:S8 family peptidase [Anaerobacillus sp. CMMVII]MCT8140320.1 S8 family peptidase [Anaerobacillus sp. CMMVII]
MHKWFSFLLVFILLFTLPFPYMADSHEEAYIVYFHEQADLEIVEGLDILQEFEHFPAVTVSATEQEFKELQNDSTVKFIERDLEVKTLEVERTWATSKIQAPLAWNSGLTGKGVKIAVIDSGITPHSNLHVVDGVSFISGITSYYDDNGHGTHVAGIIGSKHTTHGNPGVAPGASLYAIKSLDKTGTGTISSVIAGIEWAITNNMDIINMSLGVSTASKVLEEVVNKAHNAGILVVAAAGNSGFSATGNVMYPAQYSSVIAVSSIDRFDNRSTFSSTGKEVEITAPGSDIVSTSIHNGYLQMSGTSMAASFVTGSLALYKEKFPHLSNEELRKLLQKDALDIGAVGRDSLFGFGIVQAPSKQEPQPEVFSSRLFVTETTDIFDTVNSTTRRSSINPQNVTTLRKLGDWYEINTWLGPKWIKPTLPLVGGIDPVSKTIQLTQVTPMYTSPLATTQRSSLGAQKVTATHKWNDWYRINTWLGPKWIKPVITVVDPSEVNRIYVTETTDIFDSPTSTVKRSSISPQNVTTLRKVGDWYEINTWLGPKWIKPNAPLIGGIDRVNEVIQLTKVTQIFDTPLAATHRSSLGAQTVTATHKWNDWYLVNTWLGQKWLKL